MNSIKSRFPIFTHHPDLVYLDSAATSQKPSSVIDSMTGFYEKENANVHRGLYELSTRATRRYEEVRRSTAAMIGASDPKTIAFTKGTTEGVNIVAFGFLKGRLGKGDRVVVSAMEHHANLIPWQKVCEDTGAQLSVIPVDADGELEMHQLDALLTNRVRLLAVTHVSNVLGTINPVEEIIAAAHKKNIPVLIDAAQSAGHLALDVNGWGVDFLVFSAHKMFGPLGTGVLYCRDELGAKIAPLNYGGGGIKNVTFDRTELQDYPASLEAGTANIGGIIGLGAAIDFVQQLDMNETARYTKGLRSYFIERMLELGHVTQVGNPRNFGGIVSFQVEGIHPHDAASFLASSGIAVRAGHHCAQPLLESMGIPATVRASFALYNTRSDVDRTIEALTELKRFLS